MIPRRIATHVRTWINPSIHIYLRFLLSCLVDHHAAEIPTIQLTDSSKGISTHLIIDYFVYDLVRKKQCYIPRPYYEPGANPIRHPGNSWNSRLNLANRHSSCFSTPSYFTNPFLTFRLFSFLYFFPFLFLGLECLTFIVNFIILNE